MARNGRGSRRWFARGGVLAAVGVALAGASMPAAAEVAPSLGAARSFAVLGASNVASTGNTAVTGDVGVSPGTEIAGFPPGIVTGGAIHATDTLANSAQADAATAYGVLAGMPAIPANDLTNVDMGGLTLAPGVYTFGGAAQLTGALVLDAGGDSAALFVFQVASSLTTASASTVTVINGGADYDESNIFWQIGSSATLGAGTAFTGNILAYASITLVTGTTMVGNALALNGAVNLDGNTVISPPVIVAPPTGIEAPTGLAAVLDGLPGDQKAVLSWNDASGNETEFRVYRRMSAAGAFALAGSVPSADVVGTTAVVEFEDIGLGASKTYSYRVTAYNTADGESDPTAVVQVQTDPIAPTGRPSGAKSILTPPVDGPDANAIGRLNVKHFPLHGARDERSWFRLNLRRLDRSTGYTLWADDPSTEGTELVQFASITTKKSGNFNYATDTKKGQSLTFGATLSAFGGKAIEVRDAAGVEVVLAGVIPSTNP